MFQMGAESIIFVFIIFLSISLFTVPGFSAKLPEDELKVLKEIGTRLGRRDWDFRKDPCSEERNWISPNINKKGAESSLTCDCTFHHNTSCHVVSISLKSQNISGSLPPELSKLDHLKHLDLSRNLFSGSIPSQWATMRLLDLFLMGNRLSGPFPKVLTSITTLRNLVWNGFSECCLNACAPAMPGIIFRSIEGNLFSGPIPPEIGKLTRLEKLILSTNAFTGELPAALANLTNLTDMRINDNYFSGKIPKFLGNLTQLQKLQVQGCSLKGPIPSSISALTSLTDLRISDLRGGASTFPPLSTLESLKTLVLRNCLIRGEIPHYIGDMKKLKHLDLSFNKLTGQIPTSFREIAKTDFMYLAGNMLTGYIPEWILGTNKNFDLSCNNFTWDNSSPVECPRGSLNLVESYSSSSVERSVHPCLKQNFPCPASSKLYHYSLHINCGGKEKIINGSIKYEADLETRGASMFYLGQNWAFSSTGNFMDNDVDGDTYIETNTSSLSKVSVLEVELYKRARVSPLSLTYYGLCLGNGNYTVQLHFAEIIFIDGKSFNSLGKRIFDVYIQGKLVLKDFNIAREAGGTGEPIIKNFTAEVTSHTLKIQFYWAGRGTTGIPLRGFYGPLISAISVDPNFEPPFPHGKIRYIKLVVVSAAVVLLLILLIMGILWRKGCLGGKTPEFKELRGLDLKTGLFTLRQIKAATKNFDEENKLGEGGFGAVYKGTLSDGTVIAVKQLSSKSRQGNREFVNEVGMISTLQHPNLVRLYGCCVEGNQLSLVYEYMENNCLSRALFGRNAACKQKLNWPTRQKICVGIARGLAYLHEESILKIVHRDIKTSNVLLDEDMNAKISDFGLARLDEDDKTHISTRIAGTIGYMAPEYAMRGYLTEKADVYSFGVVALEIVSGKSNTSYRPNEEFIYLLDWAYVLQERGALLELVDPDLCAEYSSEEALVMLNIALLCTNASPTFRPTMSQVVSMLEGRTAVQDLLSDPGFSTMNSKFRAIRNFWQNPSESQSMSLHGNYTDCSETVTDKKQKEEDDQLC